MEKKLPFIIMIVINLVLLGFIYQKYGRSILVQPSFDLNSSDIITAITMEDEAISPYIRVLDSNLDTLKLQNLFLSQTLVLFYPSKSCKPCAEKIMSQLNQSITKYGIEQVALVADFDEMRELAVFCRLNKVKFPTYKIVKDGEEEGLMNYLPYYAIVDQYLVKNSVFMAQNDQLELMNKYIEIVSQKINMN